MSSTNNNSPQAHPDFKSKGLGWIPDYPDKRDYYLKCDQVQENGRLRREETTQSTEEIASYIIDDLTKSFNQVLDVLQNKLKISDSQLQTVAQKVEESGEQFRKKIFGGITFKTTRLHRVLRLGITGSQVLKLKAYLAILGHTEKLSDPKSGETLSFDRFCGAETPSNPGQHLTWFYAWINDNAFDSDTEYLVKAFQTGNSLEVDGIVGLESYMYLSRLLSQAASSYSLESQAKIRLTSIPSILSPADSAFLVEELMGNATDDIQNSQNLNLNQVKREFTDLLRDIKQKPIAEAIATLNQTIDIPQVIAAYQLNDPERVSKIFLTDSIIVEPIISILLRLTCPLANYKTISDALHDGLSVLTMLLPVRGKLDSSGKEFHREHLPNPADVREAAVLSQMPNVASQFRNLADSEIRALQDMSINGLQKTKELFVTEVGRVITAIQSDITDDLKSVLLFYLLIRVFINQFANYLLDDSSIRFNEFSKTELFEILDQDTVLDQCDAELSLFASPQLTIPVNDNLEISKAVGDRQKTYFFLPGVVDLSFWCSPVEDQETIKSCAALAGISLLEYFAKRSREGHTDVSGLFLYKAARNLMNVSGDVGASLRETMKAMTVFGVPPEQYWPYDCDNVDVEPPSFCYAFAQSYQALKYFRLDYSGISEDSLLFQIKAVLASGFPCMFGFTVYTSAYEEINVRRGLIPLPGYSDRVLGGHAVVAVGYSDYETINSFDGEKISKGAILIRNSWGKEWGCNGYGWLPYDYVLHGLTADWWSLLKAEWFKDDSFGLGGRAPGGRYPLF